MTDLAIWYARHVSTLMSELASVTEGTITLLDGTVIVWVTELATGTHKHNDVCTLVAGGSDVLKTGRYVRFARDERNPSRPIATMIGPGTNRLFGHAPSRPRTDRRDVWHRRGHGTRAARRSRCAARSSSCSRPGV